MNITPPGAPAGSYIPILPASGVIELPLVYLVLFGIICAVLIFFLVRLALKAGIRVGRLKAEKEFTERLSAARGDAVKRSRAVLGGQFSEQLAPYLPRFPADPTEVRFIGKPVDFIAFSGCSEGCVNEVLFIEIKTGSSALTKVEKDLKKAVEEGRVRYIEYRIP